MLFEHQRYVCFSYYGKYLAARVLVEAENSHFYMVVIHSCLTYAGIAFW